MNYVKSLFRAEDIHLPTVPAEDIYLLRIYVQYIFAKCRFNNSMETGLDMNGAHSLAHI